FLLPTAHNLPAAPIPIRPALIPGLSPVTSAIPGLSCRFHIPTADIPISQPAPPARIGSIPRPHATETGERQTLSLLFLFRCPRLRPVRVSVQSQHQPAFERYYRPFDNTFAGRYRRLCPRGGAGIGVWPLWPASRQSWQRCPGELPWAGVTGG